MNRPPLEVADLVRAAGRTFIERSRKWITWQHLKPIQKRRLLNLFEWQKRCIQGCIGSPWTAFKTYKPDADLFLRAG